MADMVREATKEHLEMTLSELPYIREVTATYDGPSNMRLHIITDVYVEIPSKEYAEILRRSLANVPQGYTVTVQIEPSFKGKILYKLSKLFNH